jgi:hypothetical protein
MPSLISLLSKSKEIEESAYSLALAVPQRLRDYREHIGQPSKPYRRVILRISYAAYLRFCRALLLPSLTESNPY